MVVIEELTPQMISLIRALEIDKDVAIRRLTNFQIQQFKELGINENDLETLYDDSGDLPLLVYGQTGMRSIDLYYTIKIIIDERWDHVNE